MQHLEGSGTPVLYIGRTVLKAPWNESLLVCSFQSHTFHSLIITRNNVMVLSVLGYVSLPFSLNIFFLQYCTRRARMPVHAHVYRCTL